MRRVADISNDAVLKGQDVPNARTPAQTIDMDDDEFTDGGLIVRAYGESFMGNPDPTKFDHAG
jgi:hypothetical protein